MMLLLSPLLTAANALARSMPASMRVSRSKPTPVTRRPANSGGSRRNADASRSMTATEGLERSRPLAGAEAPPAAAHDDDVHDGPSRGGDAPAPSPGTAGGPPGTLHARRSPRPTCAEPYARRPARGSRAALNP